MLSILQQFVQQLGDSTIEKSWVCSVMGLETDTMLSQNLAYKNSMAQLEIKQGVYTVRRQLIDLAADQPCVPPVQAGISSSNVFTLHHLSHLFH